MRVRVRVSLSLSVSVCLCVCSSRRRLGLACAYQHTRRAPAWRAMASPPVAVESRGEERRGEGRVARRVDAASLHMRDVAVLRGPRHSTSAVPLRSRRSDQTTRAARREWEWESECEWERERQCVCVRGKSRWLPSRATPRTACLPLCALTRTQPTDDMACQRHGMALRASGELSLRGMRQCGRAVRSEKSGDWRTRRRDWRLTPDDTRASRRVECAGQRQREWEWEREASHNCVQSSRLTADDNRSLCATQWALETRDPTAAVECGDSGE